MFLIENCFWQDRTLFSIVELFAKHLIFRFASLHEVEHHVVPSQGRMNQGTPFTPGECGCEKYFY